MTSLIHPIHSISAKCRPKHQVLVLKCYPKYQKSVQETKPSSSELSYLLYYASSRRAKLQKVGAFLEKKVGTDVWMSRLGNVQVSLQIVTALIEKTPRDLMLYSGSVLNILDTVLRSKDINMVEESLPTFEAFCRNVDAAKLGADKQRASRYLVILKLYADFVDNSPPDKNPVGGESAPVVVRWRTAGLRAIKAAVTSDALTIDADQQLNLFMPIILDNMSLEQGYLLAAMKRRAKASEQQDNEMAKRRRLSSATVATVDTIEDHLRTASETTADADAAAEDNVRVLALRCLKQIFSVGVGSDRGQTRLATAHVLKFVASKKPACTPVDTTATENWATSLFEAITRWTPVQDRYLVALTTVEALVRSPASEASLEGQLVLATLLDWLLSSDINLIGLSVMDVLINFIYHTLLLLQLGGSSSRESARQSDILGVYRESKETVGSVVPETGLREKTASPARLALLQRMQNCVSALSNHIYYTDQITDMVNAILTRLKPTTTLDASTTVQAISNPAATTKAIAEAGHLHDDPSTDNFFSFATARLTAFKTVKAILVRANSGRTTVSSEVRSRVGVTAWDGTQWLLKDADAGVRVAYVDALLTWLRLETDQADLVVAGSGSGNGSGNGSGTLKRPKSSRKVATLNSSAVPLASSTSIITASSNRQDIKPAQLSFLQLLHLAVYDAALERAGSESDVLLLHLLLSTLVQRLGVNAVRSGLPMAIKLQHDVLGADSTVNAVGRIHLASLIHAYLFTIAHSFGFESGSTGQEIVGEISRRKQLQIWFEKIKIPVSSAETVDTLLSTASEKAAAATYAEAKVLELRPFLDVDNLVERIATAYDKNVRAPGSADRDHHPTAGRVFSVPALGLGASQPEPEDQLPKSVKEEMASTWSRELCIASAERELSNHGVQSGAVSLSGSTGTGLRHHLSNGQGPTGPTGQTTGQVNGDQQVAAVASDQTGQTNGQVLPREGVAPQLRKSKSRASQLDPEQIAAAEMPREATVKVTDLKRALSGFASAGMGSAWRTRPLTQAGAPELEPDLDKELAVSTTGLAVKAEPAAAAAATKPVLVQSEEVPAPVRPQATPLVEDGESRPASTLHLPGEYPRAATPSIVNGDTPEVLNGDTPAVVNGDAPTVVANAGGKAESVKPDSLTVPETRVGADKIDVNTLLAGIRPRSSGSQWTGYGRTVTAPPY